MINYADVIVDLQQGDSGKGKVANYLVANGNYTHVVRYNGSNNAGHTIYLNNKKFVTHSIPAGVLHGVKSIIGPGCVVNPQHLLQEINDIESGGVSTKNLVYVANNAHVITENHLSEDSKDVKIGTTKRGNGPAYRDKYDRKGIRCSESDVLKPFIIDIYDEFYSEKECNVLFEGAQGFYLDIDWGDYPYVTSSHCTVGSAVMNGVPPQKIRKVYGVAKIYETYVGSKSFEPSDEIFKKIRQLGNEFGATTGRPRQCNWLNVDNLIKALRINGVTDLVMNKVDIFRELNTWYVYHQNKILDLSNESLMKEFLSEKVGQWVSIHWSDNPRQILSCKLVTCQIIVRI